MFSKGNDSLTINDIRMVTDDISVAAKYLGIVRIPSIYLSPLRKDEKPSLSIFAIRGSNILRYHDFGTNDQGTIYELLSKIWNVPLYEVYRRIYNDCPNHITLNTDKAHSSHKRTSSQLKVRLRDVRKHDIEYWGSYGISEKWMRYGNIYPISHIFFINGTSTTIVPAEKYAYVYVEHKDGIESLKVYQPFSKSYKWISKHDSSVWDLWTKIPEKGDKLIITSSRKDALCVWANTGIPSLSLQGEGYIPKEQVINQLKERYKTIYVLYDNDFKADENHGRIYGKELSERFNLKQIEIPTEYQSKDPSDLYKNCGYDVMKSVILHLVEQ